MWFLRIELRTPGRVVSALNHLVISPAPVDGFLSKFFIAYFLTLNGIEALYLCSLIIVKIFLSKMSFLVVA
jgi:hypothetical protein